MSGVDRVADAAAHDFNEENFAVESDAESIRYFELQMEDNDRFWVRAAGRPDFKNKFVLELGSGHGALSIDAAQHGARRVLGLDLIASRVAFATNIVARRYPELAKRMEFRKANIQDLSLDEPVDIVLSKDTFEHIMDLDGVLESIERLMKKGGLLVVGIGPLYYSPFGDHGLHAVGSRHKFPWMHLLMGDRRVVRSYNQHHPGVECKTVYDLGLNKLRLRDYLRAFRRHHFTMLKRRINASEGGSKLYPVFGLLRRIPVVGIFTTINVYAQLFLDIAP